MRGLMLVAFLGLALPLTLVGEDAKLPEGFVPLFNGKDIDNWKVLDGKKEVWGVEKGIIFCEKGGGGWLVTEKEYGNYELHIEYKLPKLGNSGVGLRFPMKGNPAYQGMEIQLIDDENWKGLQDYQHTGSVYDVIPAALQNNKPIGEWNAIDIVANGSKILIKVNGKVTVDGDLAAHREKKGKDHPGILREKGHIGLQSYNFRVEFKNVTIKELK